MSAASGGSRVLRAWVAVVVGLLFLVGLAPDLGAQQPVPGSAELKRVIGRVELLRKGQTQWVPATVGAKLVEGDDMRAFAGAAAEMELPDGSTVLLAENSRLVVSKLEFTPQNQTRTAIFHLAVGKVRAAVGQAALALVRARQSHFVITTPTAVAAARGTIFEVTFNPATSEARVVVLPKGPNEPFAGIVTCTSFFDRFTSILITEGNATVAGTSGCSAPVPIATLNDPTIGTLANPIAPGALLSAPVAPIPTFDVPEVPLGGAPPVSFQSAPTGGVGAVSSPPSYSQPGPPFTPPGPPPR